jgi:dTDP-4-dehydrorhamnose reductase
MLDRPVILVTGASGQVGFELTRELDSLGTVVAPARAELDLTQPSTIRDSIRRVRPTLIFNAGAYTDVDRAESDSDCCYAVNAEGPRVLGQEAARIGAAVIHYSTDFVFDGRQSAPYIETDVPAPINVYGASKLAGEHEVAAAGVPWIVLRVSWVYSLRRKNFLRTILQAAKERDELRVADDQIGAPTWARWIAESARQIIANGGSRDALIRQVGEATGIYHLAAAGAASKFDFAAAIIARHPCRDLLRRNRVVPVKSSAFSLPAHRPERSVLDCSRAQRVFGVSAQPWESQLERALTGFGRGNESSFNGESGND